MDATRLIGFGLIVAGALGLAYGSFSFTEETHEATVGSLRLSVDDQRRVKVPAWASIGAIVIGGLVLVAGRKR